ncbi:uncharacterized protein [Montipora capricornis]|uniref:uncharacterized protein n=1 Tax=Montipora capricornis TaxID=246305 RepID=UPI0035F1855F
MYQLYNGYSKIRRILLEATVEGSARCTDFWRCCCFWYFFFTLQVLDERKPRTQNPLKSLKKLLWRQKDDDVPQGSSCPSLTYLCFFSGNIPSHVAARLTRKYWVPHFVTICDYSALFALFAIRDYSLFAIRDYSLFAIRVFQPPSLEARP